MLAFSGEGDEEDAADEASYDADGDVLRRNDGASGDVGEDEEDPADQGREWKHPAIIATDDQPHDVRRRSEDFPAPLGPTIASIRPGASSKEMSVTRPVCPLGPQQRPSTCKAAGRTGRRNWPNCSSRALKAAWLIVLLRICGQNQVELFQIDFKRHYHSPRHTPAGLKGASMAGLLAHGSTRFRPSRPKGQWLIRKNSPSTVAGAATVLRPDGYVAPCSLLIPVGYSPPGNLRRMRDYLIGSPSVKHKGAPLTEQWPGRPYRRLVIAQ